MFIRLCRGEAFDAHAAVPFVVFENAHRSEAHRLNSRKGAENFRQLGIEDFQALGSVAVEGRVDIEADQFFRGKARPEIAQVREAANEKSCSDQQQEGKSNLGNHEAFPETMVAAAHDRPGLIFESAGNIGFRGLHRRDETKNNSGENRYGEGEQKNAEIWKAGNIKTAGIRRQVDAHERLVRPEGEGQTGDASEERQGKTLDEELLDNLPTSGANGQTNGNFFGPRAAADEQKVGEVGASDEEYGSSGGHQDPEGSRELTPGVRASLRSGQDIDPAL